MQEITWRDPIIRDGFTQRGYVEEREGQYPAVSFTFRPMMPEEVEAFEEKRERAKAGEAPKIRILLGKLLSERIEGWSVKIDDKPAVVNELHARSLRPTLQMKIYNIIAGFIPTDIDPEWATVTDDLASLEELRSGAMDQLGKS